MPRAEDVVFPTRPERFEDRRKERQQRKVVDQFFDHATLLAISRLVSQGAIDAVDFPISTGKEGGVFRGTVGAEWRAVKVYRIANTTFRHLPAYAVEELKRETSVRNFGGLVFAWTRREHTYLGRLTEAGVRVPRPYAHFRNVLVMEFVGTVEGAAPRLKDAPIDRPAELYEELVREIGRMVGTAHLVHGDLSPYNVLYFEDRVVVIDVAQAVATTHPNARALLQRDLANFARFVTRLGHPVTPDEFFAAVGGETVGPPAAEA